MLIREYRMKKHVKNKKRLEMGGVKKREETWGQGINALFLFLILILIYLIFNFNVYKKIYIKLEIIELERFFSFRFQFEVWEGKGESSGAT